MNRIERLYRKALQVVGAREERERFRRCMRVTEAFFDLEAFCYRQGVPMPDPATGRGMELIDRLFLRREYACTPEEFRKWYAEPVKYTVDIDKKLLETVDFIMDYGEGDDNAVADGNTY